jgi:hypothetical protein
MKTARLIGGPHQSVTTFQQRMRRSGCGMPRASEATAPGEQGSEHVQDFVFNGRFPPVAAFVAVVGAASTGSFKPVHVPTRTHRTPRCGLGYRFHHLSRQDVYG